MNTIMAWIYLNLNIYLSFIARALERECLILTRPIKVHREEIAFSLGFERCVDFQWAEVEEEQSRLKSIINKEVCMSQTVFVIYLVNGYAIYKANLKASDKLLNYFFIQILTREISLLLTNYVTIDNYFSFRET